MSCSLNGTRLIKNIALSGNSNVEEVIEMTEELCPVCGCSIGNNAYEKDGVSYCCEPCASGSPCECGCCKVVEKKTDE